MKKRIFSLLTSIIDSSLYIHNHALATDLALQCRISIPHYTSHAVLQNVTNNFPITITSDYAKSDYPDNFFFIGHVNINYGNSYLCANTVRLHQKHSKEKIFVRTIDAKDNVYYKNDHIVLKGKKGWINLNTKDVVVWKGNYQMINRQGRGKADIIRQQEKNRYTILKNGSFTSCLPGSNIWSVIGKKVIYDRKEQIAKIWHARFKLGTIPIFYIPYLQLPFGDKRRSGFLIPHMKYSNANYLELYLPFYWNISPNIDATITPHYIYKKKNIIWENEFRYLNRAGIGLIESNHIMYNTFLHNKELPIDKKQHQWLFYWKHSGILNNLWRFDIDYTKISDTNYFSDFDLKHSFSTDVYTKQIFSVGYSKKNFDTTLSTKRFQFKQKFNSSYAAEPQLELNWYFNDLEPLDLHVYSQAVHFINTNPDMPKSTRLHFESNIGFPWANDLASIRTEAKLMASYYKQSNLNKYKKKYGIELDNSVIRILPEFKIEGKMMLERSIINLSSSYTQTLEPRMQYLYIPYRNQTKIYNYDSSLLQSNYGNLFSEHIYGGFDRISSTNQITTSITTRIFNPSKTENYNFSIGQIYFFNGSNIYYDNINLKKKYKRGSLVWAGDTYWRIKDCWGFRGGVQYDKRFNNLTTGYCSIEYHRNEEQLVQFNYRYVNSRYIHSTLSNCINNEVSYNHNEGISQIGTVASWTLDNSWAIVGSYYYNINQNRIADQMIKIQYNSCCYAIGCGYERKPKGWNTEQNQSKFDKVIGFNVELRGLSSSYDLGIHQMLRSSILPYHSIL